MSNILGLILAALFTGIPLAFAFLYVLGMGLMLIELFLEKIGLINPTEKQMGKAIEICLILSGILSVPLGIAIIHFDLI